MMNDIKFRAWDKKNKKFLKPYREQHIGNWVNKLSINMDGSLSFHEDDGFGGKSIGGESIEKRFEIMQYTGLKDKNDTGIYVGDVLPEGYVVTFIDSSEPENLGLDIGFYGQRDNFESWFTLEVGFPHEVIGNIYENPELMEDN